MGHPPEFLGLVLPTHPYHAPGWLTAVHHAEPRETLRANDHEGTVVVEVPLGVWRVEENSHWLSAGAEVDARTEPVSFGTL